MHLSFWWNTSTGSETSVAFHWLPVWFPAQQRVHLVRKDGWRQRADAAKKIKNKITPKVAFLPTGHREARQSNPSLGNILFSSSWLKLGDNAIILQLIVPELGLIYGPATVKINGIVVARHHGCHNQNFVSKIRSWFIYPCGLCSRLWAGVTNEALMKLSRSLGDHIQEAWLNGWRATQA